VGFKITESRGWRWLQYAQAIHFVWALGGGGLVMVAARAFLDLSLGWLVVLGGSVALLVFAGFMTWARSRVQIRPGNRMVEVGGPARPDASTQDLMNRHITGKTIRLANLLEDGIYIKDRILEDCTLVGPAVLVPMGPGIMDQCAFEGDAASIFIEVLVACSPSPR